MTSCPMCFGFWSGLMFGFIYGKTRASWISSVYLVVISNLIAFMSSGSSYFEQMEYINTIEKKDIFL